MFTRQDERRSRRSRFPRRLQGDEPPLALDGQHVLPGAGTPAPAQPRRDVDDRLVERANREPGIGRAHAVDVEEARVRSAAGRQPQRQLGPWFDLRGREDGGVDPDRFGSPRVAVRMAAQRVDESPPGVEAAGAHRVVGAGDVALGEREHPAREIARVDELDRRVGGRRDRRLGIPLAQHLRLGEARDPVGVAVGRVARPDDESRTHDRRRVTEARPDAVLAGRLERAVVRGDVLGRRIGERGARRALVEPRPARVRVHRHRRDEDVAAHAAGEERARGVDDARHVAGQVDRRVPGAGGERGQARRLLRVAVAAQRNDRGTLVRRELAARERRHRVAAFDRGVDQVPAEVAGAAEDEEPHVAGNPLARVAAPAFSFRASAGVRPRRAARAPRRRARDRRKRRYRRLRRTTSRPSR